MGIKAWLSPSLSFWIGATLAEVNERLSVGDLSITTEDAQMLLERRVESLSDTERVEFGQPAVVVLAEAVATSPHLSRDDVANDLAELQDAFYSIRNELPIDIPDEEIAEALRGCLDEWGNVAVVASMPTEEIMGFSAEYTQAAETESTGEYRIVDDEGHAYTFGTTEWDADEGRAYAIDTNERDIDAGRAYALGTNERDIDEGHTYAFDTAEWDYTEQAPGWNGEGWADDWDD